MRAIVQHELGDPEVLGFEDAPDPVPGPGQVRIAVGAAGVHLIDARIRAHGAFGPYPAPDLPMIPGREVAGVVDALGPDVDGAWLGRRVAAHLGMASAGYAELAVSGVDALHAIPDGLDDAAAVAMIGTGRTTMGLLDAAPFGADDLLVVTSAAGGIGSLLVQEAHRRRARVVGLAGSAAKLDRVRALGAVLAVDYTQDGWPDAVRAGLGGAGATLAFEGVGGAVGHRVAGLVADGGRLVLLGGDPDELPAPDRARLKVLELPRPADPFRLQADALDAAATGRWVPEVTTFPLADAADAHRALEARRTSGKVVLVPERAV